MDYSDFPLESLIKLYASIIENPELDLERSNLHDAICSKLGVDHETFAPFEYNTMMLTQIEAERLIRLEIRRLKK